MNNGFRLLQGRFFCNISGSGSCRGSFVELSSVAVFPLVLGWLVDLGGGAISICNCC